MTKHINPGTDTTINPVVIDDSKREKKQQPRVDWVEEVRLRCYSYTEFYGGERAIRFDELEGVIRQVKEERKECYDSHTPAHPPEAQQRSQTSEQDVKELFRKEIAKWKDEDPLFMAYVHGQEAGRIEGARKARQAREDAHKMCNKRIANIRYAVMDNSKKMNQECYELIMNSIDEVEYRIKSLSTTTPQTEQEQTR